MIKKVLFLIICASTILNVSQAQIVFDFENHDISLWGIEGDGSIVVDTVNGNPGSSLRVNEPATGARNFVIAPPAMSGNWSSATNNDSIYWDILVHKIAGTMGSATIDKIEIRGGNNYAQYIDNFAPPQDSFIHTSASLNPANWNMVSGTWVGLMQSVEFIRIRAEYVNGDEYVLLDNVGLSFTPIFNINQGYVCSPFDSLDGLDGWNFINTGSLTSVNTDGNPPNCIRIGDASGNLSYGYAPPKFRGNFSALNDTGTITFDIKDVTNLTALSLPPYLLRLAGAGGEATYPIDSSDAAALKNAWHSFVLPLDSSDWVITAGSWSALLANVTTIEIALEYYNGTAETVYFDNFCIGNYGILNSLHQLNPVEGIHVFPNPSNGNFTVELNSEYLYEKYFLTVNDLTGRQIYDEIVSAKKMHQIDLSHFAKGLYIISVSTSESSWQTKITIE